MINKLAKLKFLPNNFEIIEEGDHVICAISKKKIPLENLNYWNVDKQEAYYSYIESSIELQLSVKKKIRLLIFPSVVSPNPLIYISQNHSFE